MTDRVCRVPVTMLESYRLLLTEDWMTPERFIEQVLGPFQPTPEMAAGSALHERIAQGEGDGTASNGWAVTGLGVAVEGAHNVYMPYRETKVVRALEVPEHGQVQLVGKMDGIAGGTVCDHKTSKSAMDATALMSSIQWEAYCWICDAVRFVYNHFQVRVDGRRKVVVVRGLEQLTLWSRPPEKIESLLVMHTRHLLSWLAARGLTESVRKPREDWLL